MEMNKVGRVLVVLLFMISAGACAKKAVPTQPGFGPGAGGTSGGYDTGRMGEGAGGGLDDARWRELGINSEAEKQEFLNKAESFENQDIYFDFDSYALSEPAKRILDAKVSFLKRYPKVHVTIEGHTDNRGTNEYNLALGERRANSALQYLKNSGMNAQDLNLVSYGEERPLAGGNDEASFAKNRRAHFVLSY
ncbi:peptidoglycan-associated lipoprotein Pal [Desulforhabdus amnigena]|nr:peptidoglycan-associated lipoprotein Pal [Desulforhabdus amnigena]NLJ28412.1 peptidoglycan-associated lipoprotein Pal [Deltaproteobacteria bacterium]